MSSSPTVIGFGSTYFHALGGTAPTRLSHEEQSNENESNIVDARRMSDRPWRRKKDAVVQVACSATSTVFVTQEGHVYQSGTMHGRLYVSPTRMEIALPRKCVEVAAGRHFCVGRLEQGIGVVSWGAGHFGQLGLGPHLSGVDKPQLISHLLPQALGTTRVQQVAAGAWHALALLDNGKVMAWGSNRKYQCGVKTAPKAPPTLVVPHPMEFYAKFAKVACGRLHSIGLEEETGRVYTWGASHFGQCGQYSRKTCIAPPRLVEALQRVAVVDVAAGDSHSLALTGGGRVFGWGSGMDGQLGLGAIVPISRPKIVSDLDFVAIEAGQEWKHQQQAQQELPASRTPSDCTGRVYTASPLRNYGQPDSPPCAPQRDGESFASSERAAHLSTVPKIVTIEASGTYSVAISSSGHVYTWGYNDVGQLGLPRPSQKLPYVEITPNTMKQSGRLLQIRTFDSRCNVLLPRRVDALSDYCITSVAAGPCHLWCIGTQRTEAEKHAVVGRTLYEVQEERRRKGLVRLREQLSSLAASTKSPPGVRETVTESSIEDLMIPDIASSPVTSVVDLDDQSTTTLETQPSYPLSPIKVETSESQLPSKQIMQMPLKQDVWTPSRKQVVRTSPVMQDMRTPARKQDVHMPLPGIPSREQSEVRTVTPLNNGISSSSAKPSPLRGVGRSVSLSRLMGKMGKNRNKSPTKSQARPNPQSRPKKSQSYKELTDSPEAISNGSPPLSPNACASSPPASGSGRSNSVPNRLAEEHSEPLNGDAATPLRRGMSVSRLIRRARGKTRQRKRDEPR